MSDREKKKTSDRIIILRERLQRLEDQQDTQDTQRPMREIGAQAIRAELTRLGRRMAR